MSEPRELPRRVVVAGIGQVGALAAVALKRALPRSEVLVVGAPPGPDSMADHAITALPFTNRFHDRHGIAEDALIARCGASHRLVTRYIGWGSGGQQGLAAYGADIDPSLKTAFAREWGGGPRNADTGAVPGSIAEVLAEAGRFAMPEGGSHPALAEVDYGLRWNGDAYRQLLGNLAQQLGVRHAGGRIGAIEADGEGGVRSLQVAGAEPIEADLFVDCTGPDAVIAGQLRGAERVDWSTQLPVRTIARGLPGQPLLALEDRIALAPAGWRGEIGGRDGLHRIAGLVAGTGEQALAELLGGEPASTIAIAPGRIGQPWQGNVVAIGDAAATFEPLGWLNLDLAHRQLALLLEMIPGTQIDPLERAEFNRRATLMAERAKDTVAVHYAAPAARQVFGALETSDELALALDQFTRRGRSPFFEEMPLLVQEWTGLLGALGIARGTGPLAQQADPREAEAASHKFRAKAEAVLASTPPYGEWLRQAVAAAS